MRNQLFFEIMYEDLSNEELDELIEITEQDLRAFQRLRERMKIGSEAFEEAINLRLEDWKKLSDEKKRRLN